MNIKDRINYLLKKYDTAYKQQRQTVSVDFPFTQQGGDYTMDPKQLYLEDFDAALA